MFEYEPTLPGGPRERNIVSASPDRSAVNDDLEGGPTLRAVANNTSVLILFAVF
jgi:hypothetical protein